MHFRAPKWRTNPAIQHREGNFSPKCTSVSECAGTGTQVILFPTEGLKGEGRQNANPVMVSRVHPSAVPVQSHTPHDNHIWIPVSPPDSKLHGGRDFVVFFIPKPQCLTHSHHSVSIYQLMSKQTNEWNSQNYHKWDEVWQQNPEASQTTWSWDCCWEQTSTKNPWL